MKASKEKPKPSEVFKGCLVIIVGLIVIVFCLVILFDDDEAETPDTATTVTEIEPQPNPLNITPPMLQSVNGSEWSDSIYTAFGNDFRSTEVGSPSIEIMVSDSSNVSFVKSKASDLILFGAIGYDYAYNWYRKRQENIEATFSAWDGSHIGATSYLKNNLNDPDSYEHVETRYVDHGTYLILTIKYRAANAFGAKILTQNTAMVTPEGAVLAVE